MNPVTAYLELAPTCLDLLGQAIIKKLQHFTFLYKYMQHKWFLTNAILYLYFRTLHVVIFILFKPTHALFLKHIHIHI